MEHLHERWEGQEQYQTLDQATLFFVVRTARLGRSMKVKVPCDLGFVWKCVCESVDCPEKTSFAL